MADWLPICAYSGLLLTSLGTCSSVGNMCKDHLVRLSLAGTGGNKILLIADLMIRHMQTSIKKLLCLLLDDFEFFRHHNTYHHATGVSSQLTGSPLRIFEAGGCLVLREDRRSILR